MSSCNSATTMAVLWMILQEQEEPLKEIGDDSIEIYNPIRKQKEVVHTYGWYMRKYVRDTKAAGAIPIVCSPIPRNIWKDGKVVRSPDSYARWAKEIADAGRRLFY